MHKNNTNFQDTVIQKIKKLRTERNISQSALSNILNISSGQIGNIESPKFPHKYTLKQIYVFCQFIDYPFELIFLTTSEAKKSDSKELLIKKIVDYDE